MTREEVFEKGAELLLNHNDALIEERDNTRSWTLRIAFLLNVDTHNFKSDSVAEQWKELRERIEDKLKG